MIFSLPLLLALGQTIAISSKESIASFQPQGLTKTYTTVEEPGQSFISRLNSKAQTTPLITAKLFVQSKLGFSPNEYVVKNSYTSDHNKVTHVYLRQKIDGKEVYNADINLNIDEKGQIISYGDSFYRKPSNGNKLTEDNVRFPEKMATAVESMESLMNYLKITRNGTIIETAQDFDGGEGLKLKNIPGALQDAKATQGWMQLDNGNLEPVWDFRLELKEDYFNAHVSGVTKEVVSLVNWASRISYVVSRFGEADVSSGRVSIEDPADKVASRNGWHNLNNKETGDTAGNNVYAVKGYHYPWNSFDPKLRFKPDDPEYYYAPLDETKEPTSYTDAAVTNLFYFNNKLHDIFYRYGFDEKAGNFQETNFGQGGKEGDAVIAYAQDWTEKNGAYFISPPDGEHGRMAMFLFDYTSPMRDSSFDSGVMIHEYSHGLSNRLTGGPDNANCLRFGESGGLGEGWSDFIAILAKIDSSMLWYTDMGLGSYLESKRTIRKYLYSTNTDINPLTFEFLGRKDYKGEHAKGEVWAEILYEVFWSLRNELPAIGELDYIKGKVDHYADSLLLQLIIDGMKLQPCNPTFLDARNAILQAEHLLFKGKYNCLLWKGFAKRGMGVHAEVVREDGEYSHKNSYLTPNC